MTDYLIRGTAAAQEIRFFAATTRETVETARIAHDTAPVVTAALGRTLTAAAMMGAMSKGEEDLTTLQIRGDGPIRGITVTTDGKSRVKGYAHETQVHLPPNAKGKLDVGGGIGNGTLSVIKDLGLKDPYIGQTNLISGEIAEDLTYYFAVSEQVPSSVALGVLVDKDCSVRQAGGFILQVMPFASDETIDRLEQALAGLPSVTTLLEEGLTPEQIMELIFAGKDVEVLERRPVSFYCNCDKARVEKAIVSLGKKEIQDIIDDNEPIEVNCHFCNKSYTFSIDELKALQKD